MLDSVTGGNRHGNDLYWGLGVLFLAVLLLAAVIGVVVLAVKLRRWHCKHGEFVRVAIHGLLQQC